MQKRLFTSLLVAPCFFGQASEGPLDRIEITSKVPAYQRTLSRVLPQQEVLDETRFSADSLANLLNQAPAINLNGQGGLLQAINIRGFARWRIQTLVEGIPIYTERRAGTAVEFLPPAFVAQAYITPGAASTQLGSGAIGGGIDLHLNIPEEDTISLGYGTNQDYRELGLQGRSEDSSADKGWSWQLNHRHANRSEDGSNQTLLDGFQQSSIALRKRSQAHWLKESLLLYSDSRNIDKASADDPEQRFTRYPVNQHWLGKVTLDWHNAAIYLHDAKMDTHISRPGSRFNAIRNEATDLGVQLSDQLALNGWQIQWRTAMDVRSGVRIFETETQAQGELQFARLNLDAKQWEASGALDMSKDWYQQDTRRGTLAAGMRIARLAQTDELSSNAQQDNNFSGFIGYNQQLTSDWQLSAYLSSAYRVPSLTERFFNGTTPRGAVLGDPNLRTETATNTELTLSYKAPSQSTSIALFHQRIDDYIERLRINDALRQYRNLDRALVRGINYQWQKSLSGETLDWAFNLGGQWLWGKDETGNPVADIAPAQHRLSMAFTGEQFEGFIAVTHRQASNEELADEQPTPGVTFIDLGYTWHVARGLRVSANLNNVTDKQYLASRDDLAPFVRGRDLQLQLTYLL